MRQVNGNVAFTQTIFSRRSTVYVLLLFVLVACSQRDPLYRQQSYVFGTLVEISIYGVDEAKAAEAAAAVLGRFDQLHHELHAWQPSDLQTLNATLATPERRISVSNELAFIVQDAKSFSQQTDGLFDPAIGTLIRLWGFQQDTPLGLLPAESLVAEQVRLMPRMDNIHVNHNQIWSDNPAVRLDLGGYAKGYALDEAAALLKQRGIQNALINIGGNVLALGRHGSRPWQVGIQHPRRPGVIATLELDNGESIGTSGDYQRYFESGGKRYCHLIDPRTGRPADGMQSVTIVVSGLRAGVRSDVLTKPLFIGGTAQLAHFSKQLTTPLVMAIDPAGQVWVSGRLLPRLKWTDPHQTFHTI